MVKQAPAEARILSFSRARAQAAADRKLKYRTNWLGGTAKEIAKTRRILRDLGSKSQREAYKRKLRATRKVSIRVRCRPGGRSRLLAMKKVTKPGSTVKAEGASAGAAAAAEQQTKKPPRKGPIPPELLKAYTTEQ